MLTAPRVLGLLRGPFCPSIADARSVLKLFFLGLPFKTILLRSFLVKARRFDPTPRNFEERRVSNQFGNGCSNTVLQEVTPKKSGADRKGAFRRWAAQRLQALVRQRVQDALIPHAFNGDRSKVIKTLIILRYSSARYGMTVGVRAPQDDGAWTQIGHGLQSEVTRWSMTIVRPMECRIKNGDGDLKTLEAEMSFTPPQARLSAVGAPGCDERTRRAARD